MLQAYETQSPKLVILVTNMVFRCKNLSSEVKDCLGDWLSLYSNIGEDMIFGNPSENNILLRIIGICILLRDCSIRTGEYMQKMTRKKKFQNCQFLSGKNKKTV